MSQPILFKSSFLIMGTTALQSLAPWGFALLALLGIEALCSTAPAASTSATVIVAVISLFLIEPPRDPGAQLTSTNLPIASGLIARWIMVLVAVVALRLFTDALDSLPRRVLLVWSIATPFLLVALGTLLQRLMRFLLANQVRNRSVVIAGYNESSHALAQRLASNRGFSMQVDGFFDDRSAERLNLGPGMRQIGGLADMPEYVKSHRIDVIFVALPIRHLKRVIDLLDELRDTTASIYYVPDLVVFDLIQARSGEIQGIPVVAMTETPFHGYRGVTKRMIDIVLSCIALVLLAPVFLVVAALVKLTSAGPVIFKQRRYGLDGHEILVYKFRSMSVTEDGTRITQATRSDRRITPVGRILRRTSLDELPQIYNVLQGRMSLVGPRPHAVAHNEEYRKLIKGYMLRHKVRPGITGLAQVSGCRGETARLEEMEARVRYDLDYLRHWTPMLDLRIMVLTVVRLLRDKHAY
ncbi:MAG: undecaprenyl-phosphate glucose phosphotransferase [Steroidobacteraceae bacterium]